MTKATGGTGSTSAYVRRTWAERIEREFGGRASVLATFDGGRTMTDDHGRTILLPDFSEQVQRGAKLLDEHVPEWWQGINTDVLDLKDESVCVLGQTWNHYSKHSDVVRKEGRTGFRRMMANLFPGVASAHEENRQLSAKYGFNVTEQQGKILNYQIEWAHAMHSNAWALVWEHLTETWLAEIRKRQTALALSTA